METIEAKSDNLLEKLNQNINIKVVKKDGTKEDYNIEKIKNAVKKAAERVNVVLSEEAMRNVCLDVYCSIISSHKGEVPVAEMHNMVEIALDSLDKRVAESYRNYRNYKQDFVHMLDKVYQESQRIMYLGDKENSNIDSTLVSTKRSLTYNELSKELYKKFFLTTEERQAINDGYIYIHDMSARLNSMNCSLFNISKVLDGGFEMGNVWYNEPKSLDVAFDVIGDIVMSASAQQYGGFTLPEVDAVLVKYAEKSYDMYYEEAKDLIKIGDVEKLAEEYAMNKVQRDFEQGFQGWEYKFNTVGSSRGDYPFITVTSGLETNKFGVMCNKAMFKVRMNGQGKKGNKKPVLFPKIVFLYDKELHGEGKELHDVYLAGIECSKKAMYPDWLSLTGEGYVASMYKKYKKVVSPMGSVDGKEVVTVKDGDTIFTTTFKELWDVYKVPYEVKQQSTGLKDKYIEPENLYISDNGKWVKVLFITENHCDWWNKVVLKNGYELTCTYDHPLQTKRGRVQVKDLTLMDRIYCLVNGQKVAMGITSISTIKKEDCRGYDVTTESDKFDVSNFCSHNCRAFLSPWYERGGMNPADEEDKPIFVGRFNIGAVSLHLPMILAKSRQENKDFYEVLSYYMEIIRNLHKRTYAYLGEMKASTNPLAFCEGGFYGGTLKYNEKIKPILKSATASFGITALNELQRLYNGKSLVEDGQFALEVMEFINKKVKEYKEEDGYLYALYGAPAESLCVAGNTLVSTVSGHLPISEINVGDLVYSFNEETKTIELKKVIAAKRTQEHAVVVKVTTDNGQEFICTPNHPFAVRRVQNPDKGAREYIEYIPASELKPGMRLKSKHTHVDINNRVYFNASDIKNYRHRINATYKFGSTEGYEVHHIDENKTNDSLDNLQLLTKAEHRRLHGNLVDHQYTSESVMGELNPFYGKKHTKEARELNRKAHIKSSVERYSLDMKHLQHFECLDDVTKYGFTRHLAKLACCGERQGNQGSHYYKDSYWFYTKDCKELLEENHKVVSVEYLDKLIPVYNITVEDNHNYYIGGEHAVLVHNCETQVYQFRQKYGIVENVSDKLFVSNSFHCHVSEDITPIEKQDLEKRFWDSMNGGKIQYVKYPISYNTEAVKSLVERAMEMGFYEGVNLSLSYCDDCGHEELNMEVCPKCGSKNLTKIDRMNGYLSYSRVKGDTRLNKGKMAEIAMRKSM